MNARSYKTVFSKRLGTLVAVGEHASSQGKANGAGSGGGAGASGTLGYIAALTASFALVSLAWAAPANNALPTAGQVVQGAASMSQAANQLTINQGTQRAAINWQSFNIGAASKVQVVQPNAQAVLLNRVVGQSPSHIFGQLSANGHVILVNPNGVLFGKDGSVNAGGFTASTLNISDANFMAGNMVYERNGSTAGIVNEGKITTAPGGYVALLGATVSNEGSIHTQGGSVVMGAGETIKVPVSGTGRIKLELTPADMNASVSNSGSIITQGGQVYIQALALNRAAAQILQSGSIDTTGGQGGAVHLLADGGSIKVEGRITANSTNGTAGGDIYIGRDKDTNVLAALGDVSGATLESKGGFVETSGDWLATYGTKVKAKDWLLDPYNINIVGAASGTSYSDPNVTGGSYSYTPLAASNIRNVDIQNSLNEGTNVKISTGLSGSLGGDVGNIYVGANIAKTTGGDATLTLEANNAITFGGGFKITGTSATGKLDVNLIAKGGTASTSSAGVYVAGGGGVDTNGKVVVDATTKYTGGWDFTKAALAMSAGSIIRGSDVDIKLNVDFNNSSSVYRVYGAFLQNVVTLEATAGNLSIDSKISTGSKSSSSNAILVGSGFGNTSILKATGGNVSLTADWSGNTGGGGGITMVDTAVSATGNILVDSKVFGDAVYAISTGNGGSGKGFSAVSTGNGDVTFTANKGGIGLGNLTTKIKGKDVTINNGTGASGAITGVAISGQGIDATGKIYIKGTATGSGAGVNAVGVYTTTGTSPNDTVYVEGTSATGNGVQIGTIGSLPSTDQAVVTIKGTSLGGMGSGIAQTGAINAKSITMTGNSVGGAGVTGLGVLTATGDVHIEGTSTASTAQQGINVANNITGGSVYLKGISGGSTGVDIGAAVKSTSVSAGDITVIGDGGYAVGNATYNQGVWLRSTGSIDSAGKATVTGQNINGVSSNSQMMGARINGQVKAVSDIALEGNSYNSNTSSHGLVITNSVESTTGNVSVKAFNQNGEKVALLMDGAGASLKAANGKVIDMIANTMDFSTAGSVNATNGIVNIRSKNDGTAIKVGMDHDYPVSQQLRLTQTELNKITAGKTVIGHLDNAGAGNIEVSTSLPAGITTNSAAGDITLQTAGNIDVKSNLSAASGQNLTLQAKGDVTVGATVSQSGAGKIVIAAGLGKAAGNGTGVGQVKRAGTGSISNAAGSKTYIYTGEVASSATMSQLNSAFTTLSLGTNAQSNIATVLSTPLSSGADTQVMYREKIAVDLNATGNNLINAVKTYGDVSQSTVDTDAQSALKDFNANKTLSWSQAGNTFNLGSDALIDTLSVSGTAFSAAQKLKASGTAYGTSSSTYSIASSQTLPTLKINVKDVTYSGVGVNSKVYDGTTTANLNGTAALATVAAGSNVSTDTKVITTDNVTLVGTVAGTFANKNVRGTDTAGANTVTLTGASLSGADASNYNLVQQAPVTANKQITAKDVTYSGVGVNSKVYDGTTVANLNGTAALATVATGSSVATDKSIVAIDASTVTLAGTVAGTFASKNVLGTDTAGANTVTLTGASLSGADASNYNLVQQAPVTANKQITSKTITVSGLSVNNKTYDGMKVASVTDGSSLSTVPVGSSVANDNKLVLGDNVSLTGTAVGRYDSKDVATTGNKVTFTGKALSKTLATGADDTSNYNLVQQAQATGDGTITPRPLTIAVGTVADKTADGTTSATVTPGRLSTLVVGETLGVVVTLANFSDANAGTGKVVTASYALQNGTNGLASNYILNADTPNPDSRLRGNILASVNPVVNPTPSPVNNNTGSRVRTVSGFGGSGAATGVLDDKPVTESREVCSDVFPENCECQPSVIPSIEICFAPKRVAVTKEEK